MEATRRDILIMLVAPCKTIFWIWILGYLDSTTTLLRIHSTRENSKANRVWSNPRSSEYPYTVIPPWLCCKYVTVKVEHDKVISLRMILNWIWKGKVKTDLIWYIILKSNLNINSLKVCRVWKDESCGGMTDTWMLEESSESVSLARPSDTWDLQCSDSADAVVTSMCHLVAIATIPCALCVILAAPKMHMKKPLSCTAEQICIKKKKLWIKIYSV